jgi:hypothetical protein
MELLGSELDPDWFTLWGEYQLDASAELREPDHPWVKTTLAPASPDERQRALRHRVRPEVRWHYRFRAALLAWEAAELLPDEDERTAQMLGLGGRWMQTLDFQAADRYYKALVLRCRQTALGAEADRLNWLPELKETPPPTFSAPAPSPAPAPTE